MGVGYAEILVRIDGNIVDPNFIVKVRSGTAATIADVTNDVAALNVLSRKDRETLEMSVAGRDSAAVVENHCSSISAHQIRKLDRACGGSDNRLPENGPDINARVECAFTIEWVNALTKRSCYRSFNRP